MERIYCYYLDSVHRLSEFLVSYESLKATGTKYPVACLVGDDICNNSKILNFLKSLNILPLKCSWPLMELAYEGADIKDRWYCSGKLELFRFEQFDKIVYLDSDTWIVKNVDDLFDMPSISATKSDVEPSINGGVMVIRPDSKIINEALQERDLGIIRKKFNYRFDQDFLNATSDINIISSNYNMIISHVSQLSNVIKSDVKIWHFGTKGYKYEDVSWKQITEDLTNLTVLPQIKSYLKYFEDIIREYRAKYPYIPIAMPVAVI